MGRKVGPYEIVERLAVGGGAEILLAKKGGLLGFEQYYVVKLLLAHYADSEEHRKIIIDEARLTARLDHPNIIKVHDLAEEGDLVYMVMEYVDGFDLAGLLAALKQRDEKMPAEVAAYIAEEMCAGLHYAHTRTGPDGAPLEIVHRDVSPQNVVIGYGGEVKLIDFGVAKAAGVDRMETKTGIIKGKLTYMAPEYAIGAQQDARSDVFATALCLYEALTGRPAYSDDDPGSLMEAVKFAKIPPAGQFSQIAPELDSILSTALQTHPDDRYQNARQLQDALTAFRARYAPNFTRQSAAEWLTRLGDTQQTAPLEAISDGADPAATGRLRESEIAELVAREEEANATPANARHEGDQSGRDDESFEPASPTEQTGRLGRGDVLLGLQDLGRLRIDDEDDVEEHPRHEPAEPEDELSVLETIAMENQAPPAPVGDSADPESETIDPDAAIRIDRDIDDLETEDFRLSDLDAGGPPVPDFESEAPTATDIDVDGIRRDAVRRDGDANKPQILTQSGFQRFMKPAEIQRIQAESGAPTIPSGPPGESTAPTHRVLPTPTETSDEGTSTGEREPPPAQESPTETPSEEREALPPAKKRIPGLEGPNIAGDRSKSVKEAATRLVGKVTKGYDEYGKTERGRRAKDTIIVSILAILFVLVLIYGLFMAD